VSGQLHVGEYELSRSMTVSEIVGVLVAGRTRPGGRVTIPEGWRAEQIATALDTAGVVDGTEFMDAVAGRHAVPGLPLPTGAKSFEGYLFPDTYEFGQEASVDDVLRRLVEQFDRKVGPAVRARAADQGMNVHEMVTLGSIVEREAVVADERPDIAAVYRNRLARGMMLQADPTTQYALVPFGVLGLEGTYWKRTLSAEDLRVDSRYNTYQVAGLPPGPICNPGLASIEAAASPSASSWLYFVARGDGTHLFAQTLDEHLRNIARVERGTS
jgi:UPF0755 protein